MPSSTSMAEMPFGPLAPVRAMTTYRSEWPPPEMNALAPFIFHWLPSRSAFVFSAAASEPDPGSVRQ